MKNDPSRVSDADDRLSSEQKRQPEHADDLAVSFSTRALGKRMENVPAWAAGGLRGI